jgi:hypothetical protein
VIVTLYQTWVELREWWWKELTLALYSYLTNLFVDQGESTSFVLVELICRSGRIHELCTWRTYLSIRANPRALYLTNLFVDQGESTSFVLDELICRWGRIHELCTWRTYLSIRANPRALYVTNLFVDQGEFSSVDVLDPLYHRRGRNYFFLYLCYVKCV